MLLYKPWRRRIDRRRAIHRQPQQLEDEDEERASAIGSRASDDDRGSAVRQEVDGHHNPDVISKVTCDTATPLPPGGGS